MRSLITSTIAVGAAAAVSFGIVNFADGGATSAEASYGDNRPCVTERELKKIRIGMGKSRVHEITDGAGRRTYYSGWSNWEDREYKMCNASWDYPVEIEYVNKRVAGIDAFWYYTR